MTFVISANTTAVSSTLTKAAPDVTRGDFADSSYCQIRIHAKWRLPPDDIWGTMRHKQMLNIVLQTKLNYIYSNAESAVGIMTTAGKGYVSFCLWYYYLCYGTHLIFFTNLKTVRGFLLLIRRIWVKLSCSYCYWQDRRIYRCSDCYHCFTTCSQASRE